MKRIDKYWNTVLKKGKTSVNIDFILYAKSIFSLNQLCVDLFDSCHFCIHIISNS